MNRRSCRRLTSSRTLLAAAASIVVIATSASGQTSFINSPNAGALTFTGGVDSPSVYFFRGMRQEGQPKLTLQPYGDLGITLTDAVKVNIGVWNSLNTGTSGTGGPTGELHYEERFYSAVTVGFPSRLSLTSTYFAYTSPNGSFNTVKEMDFELAERGRFSPYALVAFELSDTGQADGGLNKGTYLELGASPNVTIWGRRATVSAPFQAGFSLHDYYELIALNGTTTDHPFGFFSVGGLITVPITALSARFGLWDVHGGLTYLILGDTTKAFNKGNGTQAIALVGARVKY
jgi:hypothetical protein